MLVKHIASFDTHCLEFNIKEKNHQVKCSDKSGIKISVVFYKCA